MRDKKLQFMLLLICQDYLTLKRLNNHMQRETVRIYRESIKVLTSSFTEMESFTDALIFQIIKQCFQLGECEIH